ncbi:substrate-binding domain-containing protein [Mesorhizobium sp. B2-4-9]|uniref:substrate-binding domain-containing protein n=1 Tax=Mesorhizobium sp. B2-4-9 TaxID=2589940 RepID=UPI0011286369|nr:substrate-binding domain-containing protein [Mesorhizobium sp. B2-4-9]TPL21085.1 substrate-binding domain-containing protein [Mesorhizobium sp. B2-4-9]
MKRNRTVRAASKRRAVALTAGLLSALLCTAPTSAQETALLPKGADIAAMCGSKPIIFGYADGYSGNSWRKTALAEVRDELSRCPNVTEIKSTDAGGDAQKAASDINNLVAQGVNVLLVHPDTGDALLPALRDATAAGVTVVAWEVKLGGEEGVDYAANVTLDTPPIARSWADWIGANLKSGNIVFLGGVPAAPTSQAFFEEFSKGLKKYPETHLLESDYVVTNWNPADAQKAVVGLIAKYPKIDAIATDYGVTAMAAIKVFQQAGLAVPLIATVASNNELNCLYIEAKKSGKSFPYMTRDGSTTMARFAARRAVAAFEGTVNNEPTKVLPYPYADSFAGVDPKCDPSAPPDADLSGLLSDSALKGIFGQ